MSNNILEIKNLNKKYKNKTIHKDLNLTIEKGERVVIIGENGAGKTVLFKMITGLAKPTSGTIEVNGKVDIQFQEMRVDGLNMTLESFLEINFLQLGITFEDALWYLNQFEIINLLKNNLKTLSGGQKQRVNAFLALITKPDLLILDEFTTGLDINSMTKIIDAIDETIKENGMTLFMSSHQPEEIRNLSDRIILLKGGQIANSWKTSEIEEKYDGNFTIFLKEILARK